MNNENEKLSDGEREYLEVLRDFSVVLKKCVNDYMIANPKKKMHESIVAMCYSLLRVYGTLAGLNGMDLEFTIGIVNQPITEGYNASASVLNLLDQLKQDAKPN